MAIEVKVPSVGESIAEVFIGTWLKKEGDTVRRDEPVVEIETDKATLEIPAPVSGTIVKLLKAEGDSAAIGEAVASIEGGEVADSAAEPAETASAPAAAAAEGGHVMPAAAKLAAERGVDAGSLEGSGPGGRVLKEDVPEAAKSAQTAAPAPAEAAPQPAGARAEEVVRMSP